MPVSDTAYAGKYFVDIESVSTMYIHCKTWEGRNTQNIKTAFHNVGTAVRAVSTCLQKRTLDNWFLISSAA